MKHFLFLLLFAFVQLSSFAQVKEKMHSSSCFISDLKNCSSQVVIIDYPVFEYKGKPLKTVNDSVLALIRKYIGISLFTKVALDTGEQSVQVKNEGGDSCKNMQREEIQVAYEQRVNDGQILSFELYYTFHRRTRELKDSLFSAECPFSYDVEKGAWLDMKTIFKSGSEGDLYSVADRNSDLAGLGHLTHLQLQQANACIFEREIVLYLANGDLFSIPYEELKEVMNPRYYKQMPHKAPQ